MCSKTTFLSFFSEYIANIALGKRTYQSSDKYADRGKSAEAVDGDKNSDFHAGSCTATNDQSFPWWVVNLGDEYSITNVGIQSRQDCCRE